jgi:hydrogenase maturation protease
MSMCTDPSLPASQRLAALVREHAGAVIAVLGMGNELLGDDAVGHRIAESIESLRKPNLVGIPVGIALENGYRLVTRSGAKVLIMVDAVCLQDMPAGAWDLFPPEGLDSAIHSTHSVPLPLFVGMWKQDLPGLHVFFIGVNIHSAVQGQGLSSPVEAAKREILGIIAGVES